MEHAKIFTDIDATREPVPVIPTVHYNMGGIPTNYKTEVLSPDNNDKEKIYEGLLAIGEAACVSVHGANRLGTNSLIDLIVFGKAASITAKEKVKPNSAKLSVKKSSTDLILERFDNIRYNKGDLITGEIRQYMQKIMQNNCSVFRTEELISQGIEEFKNYFISIRDQVASEDE